MLSSLKKTTHKGKKRIGRGYGSKKGGHTSTRGSKGAKARYKIKLTYDGTKIKKGWIKRLPLLKGKDKNKSRKVKLAIDFNQLEKWYKAKETVSREDVLQKLNVKKADKNRVQIKVLSRGKLTKSLTVTIPCSMNATNEIIAQGGRVKTLQVEALQAETGSAKIKG